MASGAADAILPSGDAVQPTEEPTSAPALKKPSKKALAAAAKAARAKAAAEVIDLDDSEEEPTKKRKARSAEDEDFKPPAVEEVSDEQEADDDASGDTEAPRKKPSSKRRKKASDDDDDVEAKPSKAERAKKKKEAMKEEKKTFYASGAPPLAVISAGISIDAWETALEAFMPQTVKSMSDILKHNNQLSSGSKAEVASRCAECQLLGGYPRCPLCNIAILKIDPSASALAKRVIYACPGSYDEDHQRFMSCGYVCDAQKIRRIPWVADKKAPKPPVAAADDEGAAAAAAPTGGEAFSAGGAAGGLRLDPAWVAATASTASVREAAQAVAEEARRLKLSIDRMDDAELLKKCATLLIANRETLEGGGVRFGVERVIAKLASDHPQRTQREAICPANTWLADEFEQMAAASDDSFKASAYRKAATAIMVIPKPVTCGKMLSEGKDKVKGIGSGIAARIDGFITRRNGEQRNTQGAAPAATAQDDTEEPIVLE